MYAHDLKCPTSPSTPEPVGICDRCGEKRYLRDLVWQWDQRGQSLQNLRLRVCYDRCLDSPATVLRPIVIEGPEGVVRDPRPPQYAADAASSGPQVPVIYLLDGNGNLLLDDNGKPIPRDVGPLPWDADFALEH